MIDIDGTICEQTPQGGDYFKAAPYRDRIEKINRLYDDGNKIIFWTARGMSRFKGNEVDCYDEFFLLTMEQLKDWGVKFHELRLGKPVYDHWIDDKAMSDKDFFFGCDPSIFLHDEAAKIIAKAGMISKTDEPAGEVFDADAHRGATFWVTEDEDYE